MTRTLLYLFAATLIALAISVKSCQSAEEKARQLAADRNSLLEGITFYRTKDSLSAASVDRLTLTKAELEQHNTRLTQTVESMGIKLKRVQATSTTATASDYAITTPTRDTTVIDNSVLVAALAFNWSDPWMWMSGVARPGLAECKGGSFDTLDQVIYRVPREFLFIKWGTKAIRQDVVSRNPHSKITYAEYIEIKKR